MKNAYRINSLLQLIPRRKFDQLCEKWQMDKGVRNFSTWEQTCALILTYILELKSYREVELTLGIARSTFSDANSRRSHGFFEELCQLILLEIRTASTSRKVRRAIKNLIALDASEMSVHGSLFYLPGWQWKSTSKRKAGIKFSALFNVDGEWIEDFRISLVRSHDSPVSKQFEIKRDKIYVFDRGYNDLSFWWKIMQAGSDFVTRLRERQVKIDFKDDKVGVLYDGIWTPGLSTLQSHKQIDRNLKLRLVVYRTPDTKKIYYFVTSNFALAAQAIADTYKKRWAVELLFRWLKGHLNARTFSAKTVNSVKVFVSVAVLTQLLLQLSRIKSKLNESLWDCLRRFRTLLIQASLVNIGYCDGCRWNGAIDPPLND